MVKRYSIAEAKDKLTSLVHEAEEGTTVELLRRGKPVAVVLSLGEFERLKRGRRGFWEAYQHLRETVDLEALAIVPEEVFAGVRERSPGRDFDW